MGRGDRAQEGWAWLLAFVEKFPGSTSPAPDPAVVQGHVAAILQDEGAWDVLRQHTLERMAEISITLVGPTLGKLIDGNRSTAGSAAAEFSCVSKALEWLLEAFQAQLGLCRLLDAALEACVEEGKGGYTPASVRLRPVFMANVLRELPVGVKRAMGGFFERSIRFWIHQWSCNRMAEEEPEEEEEEEEIDNFEDMNEQDLARSWSTLRHLGWLPLLHNTFADVLLDRIMAHVKKQCEGMYEEPVLPALLECEEEALAKQLGQHVYSTDLLGLIGDDGALLDKRTEQILNGWDRRLDYSVHKALCTVRIHELFDIIADFPDSTTAVMELKQAMEATQQQQPLIVSLRNSLQRRLLHPGANTSQVLDMYISTIKVLRLLDPKDMLLEAVAGPVRAYLRQRKDTIRCIVGSLTDENSGELHEELRRHDAKPLGHWADSDNEEDGPGDDWEPPLRAAEAHTGAPKGDILAMLVSIYGSKELFVTEYRLMLADKLLSNLDYDTDTQVKNLELLKLRFGESSMQQCEIMVRDVDESKRVNGRINALLKGVLKGDSEWLQIIDTVMISQHFWPPLHSEPITLHPRMAEGAEAFAKQFSVAQSTRLLNWKQQLGSVQLELVFGEVTREFDVSPLHATLIMHFQDKDRWSLDELAAATKVDAKTVGRKMLLWCNQGVVREEQAGHYQLLPDEEAGAGVLSNAGASAEDHREEAVSTDANDKKVDALIQQFLMGMLTNMGKLPLPRIHNMLKMYMSSGEQRYEKTLSELESFLGKLCAQNILDQCDGMYSLAGKG